MSYDMIDRFLRNNLDDDDYAEYSAALDSLCTPQRKPLTDEQIVASARVLNQRMAEQCGVDAEDQWALYADDFKADARAVLEAAHGIKE